MVEGPGGFPKRSGRWRRALLVFGVLAALSGAAAAGAAVLLFGPLREVPAERYRADTSVRLERGAGAATVLVKADWARLGILQEAAEIRLESPDGRDRTDIALAEPGLSVADVREQLSLLLDTTPAWRSETLSSGARAEYVHVAGADGLRTVAVLQTGDAVVSLVAVVTGDGAEAYRTETADLLASMAEAG